MKWVGGLFLALGSAILLLSTWYAVEATRFLADSKPANGIVVEHQFRGGLNTGRRKLGSGSGTIVVDMYAPVVEFTGPTGHPLRFTANWSEGEPPPIGTEVGVRYRTDNVADARITGVSSLYGASAILLVLGVVFGGAGILIWRK